MTASESKNTSQSHPENANTDRSAESPAKASGINGTVTATRKRFERKIVRYRQPLLDFTAVASPPTSDSESTPEVGEDTNDQPEESEGFFGYLGERKKSTYRWRQNGFYRPPPTQRSPTLFDFPQVEPAAPDHEPPPAEESPKPGVHRAPNPLPSRAVAPPPPSPVAVSRVPSHDVSPSIAGGEKGKARDILAAIRVLKSIEDEGRTVTTEERQMLTRFCGFGPVALSIFPDPVTGRFKDASWQNLGEQLRSVLSSEEYDSAKRTTFNAFYTSTTVIVAMHQAVRRLGVPENPVLLEPGCGTGNFMTLAPPGSREHASSAWSWTTSPVASREPFTLTRTSASRTSAIRNCQKKA